MPSSIVFHIGNVVHRTLELFSQWRHLKRSSDYVALGPVRIQCELPVDDDENLLLYQSRDDGKYYARPIDEFLDEERFEFIETPEPITDLFILGVQIEASQRNDAQDANTWFCLVNFFIGKSFGAQSVGNYAEAKQHAIAAAAALSRWHKWIDKQQP